jgi:hypothetical protein
MVAYADAGSVKDMRSAVNAPSADWGSKSQNKHDCQKQKPKQPSTIGLAMHEIVGTIPDLWATRGPVPLAGALGPSA